MELFDTHAHLDDGQFADSLGEVIGRARDVNVRQIIAIGTTAESSEKCIQIARRYDGVHAAVGIQPNVCSQAETGDWARIEKLADSPEVVAIGETGLDCYWDYAPLELQQDFFDRHLRLSQKLEIPFIVHMRDSGPEVVEMLTEAHRRGSLTGVMHSFTGDMEIAFQCLELGLYISFAGMLTFKKSVELREVAAQVPKDRILIETDAPYLSPHPKRGQRPNEPSLLVHTATCLAETRGETFSSLVQQTNENAKRLFSRSI